MDESLPRWLAKAAAQWPDRPAVHFGEQSWTYADLARRAAGLAREIHHATAQPGPVALVQSVGLENVASWFACAMAGRAFLLLEPDHPPARLRELIELAACPLVLCDPKTSPALAGFPELHRLIPAGLPGALLPGNGLEAGDPAMIFPTSGSTGSPKLITYSATTLQVKAQSSRRLMQVPGGARVLIAGSHGNYGFLHHAFVFLLSGGTLCLADLKAGGFGAVLEAIERQGARHVRFTPSMFRQLASWPPARSALRWLEAVRFSGEPLLLSDLALAQSVVNPDCLIQNVYGSTESALFIWSSRGGQPPPDAAAGPTVPIGRLYPLASHAIVPLGEGDADDPTGELVIRSAFHALGDFRAGGIDPSRFPPCPGSPGERLYATGDVVRRLPDGNLIHLGRRGSLVKIRGHRVFPAEIENHLRALAGITGAAVIERGERDGPVLYAFITTDPGHRPAEDPREQLAARLPDFMVPRAVLTVPLLPLLPGGKIDHWSLLALLPGLPPAPPLDPPAADEMGRLAQIWDSILWPGAHAHDTDFASLGGDSLKLMRLSLEVERVFGRSLPREEFLADSTLHRLAALLGMEQHGPGSSRPEGLQVRCVWPGRQPSRGIALAVPGYFGRALAIPCARAGLFPGHDVWAADYPLRGGCMRDSQQWWRAAQELVGKIRSGGIPAPQIVFGVSFGGGLAWLVSRLLAGTPQCPEWVVMVDAPSLHRLPGFRPREAGQALARVAHLEPPPTLHIRRAPLPNGGLPSSSADQWQAADRIHRVIDLPTIDHLEMAREEVLAQAAQAVHAFLGGQYRGPIIRLPAPDTLGARLHQALSGEEKLDPGAVESLIGQAPRPATGKLLIALLHLAGRHGRRDIVRELVGAAVEADPRSKLAQFVHHRLQRRAGLLCPRDMPKVFPEMLAEFDQALAISGDQRGVPAPRLPRFLCLAYDLGRAVLLAHWSRFRR